MKYTEIDLQCEDIMWFGVDKNGYIFECTSGGIGCVPPFVCNSKEDTEHLEVFFLNKLKESTQGTLLIPDDGNQLSRDGLSLSRKGIFCFDVATDEGRPNEYKKIAVPVRPLNVSELPNDIKNLMNNHTVDIDVSAETFIKVPHAF